MKFVKNPRAAALAAVAAVAAVICLGGCANTKLQAQRNALLKQNKAMQAQLAEAQQQSAEEQATAHAAPTYQPTPPPASAPSGASQSGDSQFLPLNEKLPKNRQKRNGDRHFSWKKYRAANGHHAPAHHGRMRHVRIVHHGRQTRLIISSDVLFPSASARILPRARRVLLHVAYLIHHRYYHRVIKVEGFTDKRPIHHPYKNNYALGLARARSVMRFLAQHGVRAPNMHAISFGAKRPVSRSDLALNRRVEIVVE